MSKDKKRGLGRGLNALFEDEEGVYPMADPDGHTPGAQRRQIGIDQLEPGPWQPRKDMDQAALKELADSISVHGVLQPLLVRPKPDHEGRFQIIAGERRWRASQKAQLHEVPVVIKELEDEAAMEIALIENLQRADLNALEEALGYQRLMEEFGHTQEKLATALGKSRSHVANMTRLLGLPQPVQNMLRDGKISAGHARALITAKDPEALAKVVVANELSVRATEKLAADESGRVPRAKGAGKAPVAKDVDTLALEKELTDMLGLKVTIDVKSSKEGEAHGSLKVDFRSLDQLDEVLHRLSNNPGRGGMAAG